MRGFTVFWFGALFIAAEAQPTFMNMFRGTGTAQANLNELTSGNLKTGLTRGRGTSIMDGDGNMLQSKIYDVDTFLVMQSVERFSDNEYFFAGGYYKDSCTWISGLGTIPHTYPVVGRMDSLGNILHARHYVLNGAGCFHIAGDIEVLSDKSVLAWGGEAMFALKTDSVGSLLWARHFDRKGSFRFVKELPGGDLLAGINMDTAGAVLARLDAMGNFIWCKSYLRPSGMVADGMVESDDSFIITGFTDSTASTDIFFPLPPDYDPKLFVMKVNGDGEVQWCKGYETPYTWYARNAVHIVRTQDGNNVLLANLGYADYNRWYRPFLMKLDGNGDTLWTRSNGRTSYTYETRNLLAYSDGGLIYNGRIWGDLPEPGGNFAFLYKANAQGHLPCFERSHPVQVVDLFPTDSSFTMTSVDGAVAYPAFIEDAPPLPITMYDGCTFTTGVDYMEVRKGHRPVVRPNPNTGRFTVEFQDPLMAESYYSVYDALGKLLYQRPLPAGATLEEVDLGRFGSGTYVIKFTEPEGTCYERVVVE